MIAPKVVEKPIPPSSSMTLLDEKTGASVLVEKNSQGHWDFQAAAVRLKSLQKEAGPAPKSIPAKTDAKLQEAQASAERARRVYVKAKLNFKKSQKAFDESKTPKQKAFAKETMIRCEWLFGMAYKKFQEKVAAIPATTQKNPAYHPFTFVGVAFGRCRLHRSRGVTTAPISIVISKPIPQPPSKKTGEAPTPSKKIEASKSPASDAKPASKTNGKATAASPKKNTTPAPKPPAKADSAPEIKPSVPVHNFPPSSQKDPILVKAFAPLPNRQVKVISSKDEVLIFDLAKDKPKSHGNGLTSVRLQDGRTIWLQDTTNAKAPEISAPPSFIPPPPVASVDKPSIIDFGDDPAKPKPPVTGGSATGTPSTETAGTISDAEAGEYTVPVAGYPIEGKFPFYIWKHKTENKFLAVNGNQRLRLAQGNFVSLHKHWHPEAFRLKKGQNPG